MCRDIYGADILGKGHKYPVAYFRTEKSVKELVQELNLRAAEAMKRS